MLYVALYLVDLYTSALVIVVSLAVSLAGLIGYGFFIMEDNKKYANIENGKSWEMEYKSKYHYGKNLAKKCTTPMVIFGLIFALMPSRQTVVIATGAYVSSALYTEYKDSPILKKTIKLVDKELDRYLEKNGD